MEDTGTQATDHLYISYVFGFRIGSHIPVPGIDPRVLQDIFSQGNLLGFLDLFSGGALKGCRYLHWG